jgi:hypothetical protein
MNDTENTDIKRMKLNDNDIKVIDKPYDKYTYEDIVNTLKMRSYDKIKDILYKNKTELVKKLKSYQQKFEEENDVDELLDIIESLNLSSNIDITSDIKSKKSDNTNYGFLIKELKKEINNIKDDIEIINKKSKCHDIARMKYALWHLKNRYKEYKHKTYTFEDKYTSLPFLEWVEYLENNIDTYASNISLFSVVEEVDHYNFDTKKYRCFFNGYYIDIIAKLENFDSDKEEMDDDDYEKMDSDDK